MKPADVDSASKSTTGETLSDQEREEVNKLREKDREACAHEQAHVAAGGSHIRGGIQTNTRQDLPADAMLSVVRCLSYTSPVSGDPQKPSEAVRSRQKASKPGGPLWPLPNPEEGSEETPDVGFAEDTESGSTLPEEASEKQAVTSESASPAATTTDPAAITEADEETPDIPAVGVG